MRKESFVQELPAAKLLEMYSDSVYRLAFLRTQNVSDAQDITQEVFLKYIKSNKKFNDEEHRKAWLLKVTVNACKTLMTSAWRRHYASLDAAAEIAAEMQPDLSEVYSAVMKLPDKYKTAIHLYYYEEYSVKEISAIEGCTESAVKSQLSRARQMLKSILEEEDSYV